jgi:hypothetical protein
MAVRGGQALRFEAFSLLYGERPSAEMPPEINRGQLFGEIVTDR